MSELTATALVGWFRRHERKVAITYLAAVVAAVLVIAVPSARIRVVGGLQRAADIWQGRWDARLQHGKQLLDAGRAEEAVAYLEELDRVFPATDVRHALDQRRELLLVLLARAYEALDRRSRTIETYQRLVAFDPRNFRNHLDLARASERLLSGAFLAPEARDAYAAALTILPVHLPSLRGYIDYYLDHGEYPPVVRAYETYLDAFLVQRVEARFGSAVLSVPVLVDGRAHDFELPLPAPVPAGSGPLVIGTYGFSAALEHVSLQPALIAGAGTTIEPTVLDVSRIETTAFERAGTAYRAVDETSALRLPVPDGMGTVATLRIRVALFKPVDRSLFDGVVRSYRNTLNDAGLEEARARSVVIDSADAADRVLTRLPWYSEGIVEGRE